MVSSVERWNRGRMEGFCITGSSSFRINQDLCLDNGLGRAPVFFGNTDSAIGAFLRIDGYRLKYEPLTVDLVTCDDSPFGTSIDADTALETSLGNCVSHGNLS
jgi:hypothetical protein